MSSHQFSKDKPRASKCHHFCHAFDTHNYCPTCREAGKGDDPSVTFISPCEICISFMEEQLTKISHRKRYVNKPDKKADRIDQELDLLGDNSVESFVGSQADLKSAADNLFTSPPRPQPLAFEALSLKTPAKTVPPTPGTVLQQKLETKLEKSLGSRLDIQLDQKMGAFQANILEAMKSLREDFQKTLCKSSSQVEVDQISASASKPGPSNTRLDPPSTNTVESMDIDYGPALPPCLDSHGRVDDTSAFNVSAVEEPSRLPSAQPKETYHSSKQYAVASSSASDHYSDHSDEPRPAPSRAKKHTDESKHKSRSRYLPSSSEEDQSPEARHRSPKPSRKTYSDQDHPQHDPDPPYYREVALSDIPSQYVEEVDTFRRILKLPDPRDSLPRSSTVVMGLDNEKGRQELRPRGPSSMLPLNSIIKDAFDKFDQDFQAANLPEGKYIRAPPSTRQNISTLNFTTTFAKTSSSCNSTLEKCQHSLKATFKMVKSQIRKGADPEKVAKHGYEEACEYLDIWNKTLIIQHWALTCLSKSLAHILQRELYSMGNIGLLKREAEMTLLQPHLGETRRQELRNAYFLFQVSTSQGR